MDSYAQNYMDWWQGVFKEESAKLDKMEAQERMERTRALEDFNAEASAAKDWLEADWEQFKARVQQWTNSAAMSAQDD